MSASRESTLAGVGTLHISTGSASLEDDDGYVIHGIALGAGDVTVGQSGTKKLWPAEELEKAAETLEGTDLVRDHINTTEGKVGEVTHAEFIQDVGVIYEATIAPHYEDLGNDVKSGLMEVSVRAYHAPEDQLEEDEETGALIVSDVLFDNLSVVNSGAAPSNTADSGPVDEIKEEFGSVEASAAFEGGQATAVLSRSTAVLEADEQLADRDFSESSDESEEASTDDDPTTKKSKTDSDIEENKGNFGPDHDDVFETKEDAVDRANDIGLDGAHQHEYDGETYYMPGPSHEDYMDAVAEESSETTEENASSMWEEGDMVQWQVRPDMFGEVVHNPDDEHIVMVEVYEKTENGIESTGVTNTAGYTDIIEYEDGESDMEEEAESEEVDEFELNTPEWETTSEEDWSELTLDSWEFDSWDELSETQREIVAEHFCLSTNGSTPDQWGDVNLSVVDTDGALNRTALERAYDDVDDIDGVSEDVVDELREWITETLAEEFDVDTDEMGSESETEEMESQCTDTVATTETASDTVVRNAELNSIANMIDYETADPEELGEELDDPVVVEKSELEDMADKAEKAESVESELGELSQKLDEQNDAGDIVDQLGEEDIDLIESETEISVVEASQAEMFDEVQSIYAEELAEHYPGMTAESLAEKFAPTELREMVEEHGEAELSSSIEDAEPEPEAGSASEEELGADEDEAEKEELREQYAEELERQGWTTQAQKVRDGEIPITAE